ncbi:type I polyketide synthase [Mesorhizobium silamurunense]|uniref:type I polyketide synthase n=1 Tax=Mesorhizobium silamurunense TaxID=499528 RepID=UPI00177C9135|nr:type I polyketide synthase [Mesorhizobium silamurunense]
MKPQTRIAVVSLSCRFPDSGSPTGLWQNAMEGRRAFRAIPKERLNLEQYAECLLGEADSIAPVMAGLLTGWEFDRARFRVPMSTFEATDMAHWLALELAADAICKAGLDRLDRSRTAVIVANTLTGEFSRAAMLRHRLPFLDAMLANAVQIEGLEATVGLRLRQAFGAEVRKKFPPPNEDSLAGGLANTIAGRIANHFDLGGGAYTVDGACASSLVAVADAANLLASHQVDAVVVGGVDLSIDPFELVGFSRNGALAKGDMRVFDANSAGFWPGEGGAFALIVRDGDARRAGFDRLAVLRGWGISTDGAGGLTRPSSAGQLVAYRRAYESADADPADLAFVEAHGTGTAVGDPTEIRALASLRGRTSNPLLIGSIKANIGHTKAAAGFAGLAKAIEALRQGVLPPHVGCRDPHPAFAEVENRVQPAVVPTRIDGRLAGVSSFGFGGINAHVVIEQVGKPEKASVSLRAPAAFDAELFLFSGATPDEVARDLDVLLARAPSLSISELSDASAATAAKAGAGNIRAAVVASETKQLAERLLHAKSLLENGRSSFIREAGVLVGKNHSAPRIGFAFPGQGAPSRPDGGLWARCFSDADAFRSQIPQRCQVDSVATEVAQPTIVAASMAGLALLERLSVVAEIGIGHSLGEISALAWGGVMARQTAVELAAKRGAIMADHSTAGGSMLRVALPSAEAEAISATVLNAVVACENGRNETVIAGPRASIESLKHIFESSHIDHTLLATSHAFHSADIFGALKPWREALAEIELQVCEKSVVSTVIGEIVGDATNLRSLLTDQLVRRVRFEAALKQVRLHADILVEVGPGQGLVRLIEDCGIPALAIDAFGQSINPLLVTLGELHARGHCINCAPLFAERAIRQFDPAPSAFLTNPCGSAAVPGAQGPITNPMAVINVPVVATGDSLSRVLSVISTLTGLPQEAVGADDRFLEALHLNSLSVSRIVTAAANALGVRPPAVPTEFANATPRILASALDELREFGPSNGEGDRISGARLWVDTYAIRWVGGSLSSDVDTAAWSTIRLSASSDSPLLPTSTEAWLLHLPHPFSRTCAEVLISVTAEASRRGVRHFAIVHKGSPISAFARSLALEGAFQTVRVVDFNEKLHTDETLTKALRACAGRYTELRVDSDGSLKTPEFVPLEPATDRESGAVGVGDVALIVGGGRGITAECSLELGKRGAALILVGRTAPENKEVSDTLARAHRLGINCTYVRADACDAVQLRSRLAPVFKTVGTPSVLVHAAAVNEPMRISNVDAATARRCLAPKIDAFDNALSCCGSYLRRIVTFGSLIGRIGLEGEAHYALANSALTDRALAWASSKRGRSALALEWSIWGGVGMGERLGTIDRLTTAGVDPISVDDALTVFNRLVESGASGAVAVTSRFGFPYGLDLGSTTLPSLRFVDRPVLHYPGKEIVLETEILPGRDRYLDDHIVGGHRVFPGVMALEALGQAALCLSPQARLASMERIVFERAIHVGDSGGVTIRLAAVRAEGRIETALFAADDNFLFAAVRATFRLGTGTSIGSKYQSDSLVEAESFDAGPLYGRLFFHSGRFRRVDRFLAVNSRSITATLTDNGPDGWFGSYEAAQTILWDPGLADACMHALQAAIPHRTVLPVSIDQIELVSHACPKIIRARERKARPGFYVFDIEAETAEGQIVQRWTRAAFQSIGEMDASDVIACEGQLITPFLERVARETFGDESIKIAVVRDQLGSRQDRRNTALSMLKVSGCVDRRTDGRPIRIDGKGSITIAHRDSVTLAVTAKTMIGCDIETSDTAGPEFVAVEACRKIDRQISPGHVAKLRFGGSLRVDDMHVLVVSLPVQAGFKTVALAHSRMAPE